jgi:hypothetical protein
MSNPSQSRVQAGVPDGGRFAKSQRGEDDAVTLPTAAEIPTDPIKLMAFHDRQREAEEEAIWSTRGTKRSRRLSD